MLLNALFILIIINRINGLKLRVSNGWIEGKSLKFKHHQQVHAFKKLPFAEPPLGDLRFRKPQPALNWSGTLNATEYGSSCMTTVTNSDKPFTINEDCLQLNVFTSDRCLTSKKCPVFVMLHGGGFIFGNGVQYNDTQIFEKYAQHEIVVVLPQHRLNLFGYFDFGQDYEDAPYNIGLYDLIAGLEWIQKEIHVFGGDPRRVTMMGYSSGATAIQYLVSSPKLQDHRLFSQAMIDSGLPIMAPYFNREVTEKFLEVNGCLQDPETNETLQIHQKLQCLRSKPADEFNKNVRVNEIHDLWAHVGPQSNVDLLPARTYAELAETRNPIPLIVLTARDEMGRLYETIDTIEHTCREDITLFGYTHEATVEACVQRYEEGNDTYPVIRDVYHAGLTHECRLNKGKAPCYFAIFAQANHSQHANEMLYVMGQHFDRVKTYTVNDELMDKLMPQLVRNFVKGKKPLDDWEPTNLEGKNYYWLDFEVTFPNQSEHQWPHLTANQYYDPQTVDFFLSHLRDIEEEAKRNYSKGIQSGPLQLMSSLERLGNEGFNNTNEEETEHIIDLAFLWTLFLLIIIILLAGILVQIKRQKIHGYTYRLLEPSNYNYKFNYQAI